MVLSFGRQPSIPDEERTDAEDMPDYLPEDDPVEESNMVRQLFRVIPVETKPLNLSCHAMYLFGLCIKGLPNHI